MFRTLGDTEIKGELLFQCFEHWETLKKGGIFFQYLEH